MEGVEEAGEWATVYNTRVADFHTYFVCDEWGFCVWAHNQYRSDLRRSQPRVLNTADIKSFYEAVDRPTMPDTRP